VKGEWYRLTIKRRVELHTGSIAWSMLRYETSSSLLTQKKSCVSVFNVQGGSNMTGTIYV
jgi:hypothetical protein